MDKNIHSHKNLHSKVLLTEFSRDFDSFNSDSLLSKFFNKVTLAYNNVNSYQEALPTTSTSEANKDDVVTVALQNSGSSGSSIESHSKSPKTSPIQTVASSIVVPSVVDTTQARTTLNVVRRISNLIKSNDLHDYKNSELQKLWMPDAKSKECYECSTKFTTLRRRHHCRLCGQIFCSKCCNQLVPGKIVKCSGDLKVCTYCSKVVLSYLKSSDIALDLKNDLQALEDDLSNKFVTASTSLQNPTNSNMDLISRRKISVGYQEERLVSHTNVLSNADRKSILQQSNSLKQLYEEMMNSLPRQNKGQDLVMFLIINQKSSNKIQAAAILTAMIEAGFLFALTNYDLEKDQDESSKEEDSFQIEFNESLYYKLQKIEDIASEVETDSIKESRSQRTNSISENAVGDIIPPSIQENLNAATKEHELQNSILATAGSKPLLEAYCDHEELLLAQLLGAKGLDQSWSKVLIPLCARIAHTIHPEFCRTTESMDVRNFVNFKKVSGGARSECKIIGGVVCSKNVAHKNMMTRIENPKVLLLQCAIAYQRIEGKFVTIESLLLQEKEYLRNVTSRILSLKPDVMLVHKNVAGIAQDMLRENGVTLVLDVKLTVLERLSRCLECDIITSIDSNIGKPKLGKCSKFNTKQFRNADGVTKNLMFFEIPYSQRGCSLLLRGGSDEELGKIKKVASFLLFARYNFRLELSFLLDEFARPPSPKHSIFDSNEQSPVNEDITIENPKFDDKQNLAQNTKRDKVVSIENVCDNSDPLRAENLSPSAFAPSMDFAVQATFDNRFRTSLSSSILSVSPYISMPLPYLESEAGRKCFLRSYFPNELYYSKQWAENVDRITLTELPQQLKISEQININPPHEFLSMKITAPIDNKDQQTAIANFRRCGGRYPNTATMNKLEKKYSEFNQQRSVEDYVYKDALDIINHQRLPVLFSSYYYNSKELPTSFCAQPCLLFMHFYGQDDIMLGLFLERYCFRSSYICASCKLPMMDHVRRYAHFMGCVYVKIDEDPKRNDNTNILITSRCKLCNAMTPSVAISPDSWCLSLAKFLELKFHGHSYKKRNIDTEGPASQDTAICGHSLHKDYIQYFSSNGVIVSFMYQPVDVWEIKLPSLTVKLQPSENINHKAYVEKIKNQALKGYEIYAKIHEKLANLSTDVELPMLVKLKKVLHRDQLLFKHRVEVVQTLLAGKAFDKYEINDAILLVQKDLADSIELWGPRLNQATIHTKNSLKSDLAMTSSTSSIESATICTEELLTTLPYSTDDSNALDDSKSMDILDNLDGMKGMEDIAAGSDSKSCKEKFDSKEKIDKKTIRSLLSTLLPSTNAENNSLPSPFSTQEHFCLPTGQFPILVHDHDLSSIIAYSLVSYDYQKALNSLNATKSSCPGNNDSNGSPNLKRKSTGEIHIDTEETTNVNIAQDKPKKCTSHVEILFSDNNTHFTAKLYFAKEFDDMRSKFLDIPNLTDGIRKPTVEEARKCFARSLSQSIRWEARGGKSGSKFNKTCDDAFILKEMNKHDVLEFEKFAPNYFEYINMCLVRNMPTLLAKIFGVYKVVIKKKDSVSEKAFLVIENLFCCRKIASKYDLKGSERNRLVDLTGEQTGETVLLDENFIKSSWSKPLYILSHSRAILKEAIKSDATFLEKNYVMDYSLLLGLDSDENCLVVGIIDYIRKFTIDKRIESYYKQLVDQSKLPTIVSPTVYKLRFIDAMDRYFLTVPDRWEGLQKMFNK